ncbi:MAG: type IV pilin, partial [Thermoplasmata archaeon]
MKVLYRERRKEKGVSEVIGTILILGITVTLFSTIFYYVAVMPPPKAQIYASFSSNYNLNPNGSFNITILNSGGEPVPVNYTELVISTQNSSGAIRIIHMLSYSKIANQLKGNYFNVG